MKNLLIAAVIIVLVVLGWMYFAKGKTNTYAPNQTYTQATPAPQDEVDQEINSIDSNLNSTSDADFDPASLSDSSVGM